MTLRTAIRVINLERATARREKFTQDAKDASVEWEFFKAYTGIAEPLRYDERAAVRRFGVPLTVPEIGCYTSHYKVWEWFMSTDYDQLIVMEDDVLVEWTVIRELIKHDFRKIGVDRLHFFFMYPFKSKTVILRFLSRHIHLLRAPGIYGGTQGYLLTRRAAERLLAEGKDIRLPVDHFFARYWIHRLLTYTLFPFPVIERFGASTIGDDRDHTSYNHSLMDRLIYRCWYLRDQFQRAWTQWLQIFDGKYIGSIDAEILRLHRAGKGTEE
jgi:glycosyl transferase, family 25